MRLKHWVIAMGVGMTLSLSTAFMLDRRGVFLPGRTSDGHHTIEQACNSCHVAFAAVPNKNCSGCHTAEIKEDTHPVKLFDDPRWAEMLVKVNALECVDCHGAKGDGKGGMAASLRRKPTDLTRSRTQALASGEIFWRISKGDDVMPSFEKTFPLSEEERWQLVHFVKNLGNKK